MIDDLAIPTTPDEFLRWEGGGDFRWELVDGEAIRLPRDGTRAHATIAASLICEIMEKVDDSEFLAGASLLAVKTPSGIRIPDVVVDVAGGDGSSLSAIAPVLIAEIISPWSRERDFAEKSTDYAGIPSLQHYLVLEQDEPRLWLWSRGADGEWRGPEAFGRSSSVPLPGLGITLSMNRLRYRH